MSPSVAFAGVLSGGQCAFLADSIADCCTVQRVADFRGLVRRLFLHAVDELGAGDQNPQPGQPIALLVSELDLIKESMKLVADIVRVDSRQLGRTPHSVEQLHAELHEKLEPQQWKQHGKVGLALCRSSSLAALSLARIDQLALASLVRRQILLTVTGDRDRRSLIRVFRCLQNSIAAGQWSEPDTVAPPMAFYREDLGVLGASGALVCETHVVDELKATLHGTIAANVDFSALDRMLIEIRGALSGQEAPG